LVLEALGSAEEGLEWLIRRSLMGCQGFLLWLPWKGVRLNIGRY